MKFIISPLASVDPKFNIPGAKKPTLIDAGVLTRFSEGKHLGVEFLAEIGTNQADPDELYFAVISILSKSSNIAELTKLRGFLRPIQKALEGNR